MRHVLRLLAGAALFAAAPVFAADSLCPETVSAKQAGTAPAPEWSVSYSTSPNQLEMVTFYSGPPKDEASLVYDDFVSGKDSSLATWKFPRDARGYWVKCTYRGTTLELSKPLPSTLSSCRVTYNRDAGLPSGLPAIPSIGCR
jgi:hypothetical protein